MAGVPTMDKACGHVLESLFLRVSRGTVVPRPFPLDLPLWTLMFAGLQFLPPTVQDGPVFYSHQSQRFQAPIGSYQAIFPKYVAWQISKIAKKSASAFNTHNSNQRQNHWQQVSQKQYPHPLWPVCPASQTINQPAYDYHPKNQI